MNRKQPFALCFVLLLLALAGKSQSYNFYSPEANKKLPEQFIYALSASETGHLLVGTGSGIACFNGKTTRTLAVKNSADQAFCTALLSSNDTIWAGFNNGKLAYSKKLNDFTLTPSKANSKITGIIRLGNSLWYSSQNALFSFSLSQTKLEFTVPKTDVIRKLISLASDKILLLGKEKSYVFNSKTKNTQVLNYRIQDAIQKDGACVLLLENELALFKNNALTVLCKLPTASNSSTKLAFNKRNYLLINELGITKINQFNFQTQLFQFNEPLRIECFSQQGSELWLGAYGSGLRYFNLNDFFSNYPSTQANPIGLLKANDHFLALYSSAICTYSIGVFKQEIQLTKSQTLPFKAISFANKGDGSCWIGSADLGVFSFDVESQNLSKLQKINAVLPKNKAILSIEFTAEKINIAVAQHGLFQFDKAQNLVNHLNTENGLLHNDIYKSYTDKAGNTWLVSLSSGLMLLKKDQTLRYFGQQDGLSSLEFTDICEDYQSNIWLSTEGGGLTRITPENQVDNFTMQSGLSADYFYGISNEKEVLTFYSRSEINLLLGQQLRRISENEIGFTANFTPRSIYTAANYTCILHEKGLLMHWSNSVAQSGKLKINIFNGIANDDLAVNGNTLLPYSDYKLSFSIEQACLNPYFESELEYKLTGFDKEWQRLTSDNLVYQSLRDNSYTLQVRELSNPSNIAEFSFEIAKPIWKKVWFYMVLALLLSLVIYVIFKIRIRALKRSNKELEEKVSERTRELKSKNLKLEQFSFAMSHDLKNPAINVVELIRILREDGIELPEMSEEVFTQLENSADTLLKKLLDLVEVLKQSKENTLLKETVNFSDLLNDIFKSIQHSIDESAIQIKIEQPENSTIEYNKSNLQSIIYNLVSNAIKYRRKDIQAYLNIKLEQTANETKITVSDNGIGIDLEQHAHKLFGIFQRFNNEQEGSGIGLHLVKSIVENNGGKIELTSELNKGTTFIVTL